MSRLLVLRLPNFVAAQLTVTRAAPLHNAKIGPEEMIELRKRYREIHQACADSGAGFRFSLDTRRTMDVPEEERLAFWEDKYTQKGFAKWLGGFADHLKDREANKAFSDFNEMKIRQRVHDPIIADKLIPKNHGYGTRRVPLETNYFDVYNLPNVRLVDATADSPIAKITAEGVTLQNGESIPLDVLVYATGFDAITGALTRGIDLRGVNGVSLAEAWEPEGIQTFLGLFVKGFPNMAMVMGPHQAYGNIPRSIEFAVESINRFMKYCKENEITYAEPKDDAVRRWTVSIHS